MTKDEFNEYLDSLKYTTEKNPVGGSREGKYNCVNRNTWNGVETLTLYVRTDLPGSELREEKKKWYKTLPDKLKWKS